MGCCWHALSLPPTILARRLRATLSSALASHAHAIARAGKGGKCGFAMEESSIRTKDDSDSGLKCPMLTKWSVGSGTKGGVSATSFFLLRSPKKVFVCGLVILFLLLLTSSASTCLQHSPNHVQRLFSGSVHSLGAPHHFVGDNKGRYFAQWR